MKKTRFSSAELLEFFDLLNLVEDYISTGFRREQGEPELSLQYSKPVTKEKLIADIAGQIMECKQCGLSGERHRAVPGAGSLSPMVLVIGEGPGEAEDLSGRPFVGKAGQYLDKWLAAVKIGPDMVPLNRRTNTFITNIVKCRPPNNRDPSPEEANVCLPYLERQITALKPKCILTLGRIASRIITGNPSGITALRGHIYSYENCPVVPTFHPSAVLRNPSLRQPVWTDLKLLKSLLETDEVR